MSSEHYEGTTRFFREVATRKKGIFHSRLALGGNPLWTWMIERHVIGELKRIAAEKPLHSLLDAACGRGNFTWELAQRLPEVAKVVGCDFTEEMLLLARAAKPDGGRVRFEPGDLRRLPYRDGEHDAVVCIGSLHHVAEGDQETALHELGRVARRVVLIEIKNADSLYFKRIHPGIVGNTVICPTTEQRVAATLAPLGFRMRACAPVFRFSVLSPLVLLVLER